jgi:hypothetical protein
VTRAADDDRDPLLAATRLVVLVSGSTRLQLEPVQPEGHEAERASNEAHRPAGAGRLELGDVHERIADPGGQ